MNTYTTATYTNSMMGGYMPMFVTFVVTLAFMIYFALFTLVITVSMWKIFTKAGKAGWASLIPFYNTIVMLEVGKLPIWFIVLNFIPTVNIFVTFLIVIKMGEAFGKSKRFILGMLFLPLIFYPILAFGKSKYIIEE